MKNLRKTKGITLIALVITIIILLILAGVTLNIVFNGGLMDKAQNSVDQYADKAQNETEILEYIDKKFGQAIGIALDNTSGSKNEKLIEQTNEVKKYCNPVIPVGFKTVNTEKASWEVVEDETLGKVVKGWNEGLVIEDKVGNQFVWVPVDGTNVTFTRWTSEKNGEPTADNTSDDTDVMPVTTDEETTMISTYGGFYIGRYEAGIPSTLTTAISTVSKDARNVPGTPVVKQNQVPWSCIDYEKASANAKKVCEGTNVKSGLVTGRMWDATMKWIESLGGTNKENDVQNDSRKWGNYYDAPVENITEYSTTTSGTASWTTVTSQTKGTSENWFLKTGHTEYTNRKNIYDLAGNLWEWTAEVYSTNRVGRGGDYSIDGAYSPAAYRIYYSTGGASYYLGFRVSLFIQ